MSVLDVQIVNEGTIVLLRPLTTDGEEWLASRLATDAQRWGMAYVAEPRYVLEIAQAMRDDGLVID